MTFKNSILIELRIFKSNIRRKLFVYLKNLFFAILNRLDESFSVNFRDDFATKVTTFRFPDSDGTNSAKGLGKTDDHGPSALAASERTESETALQLFDHAVVLNTNDSVASTETIRFLIEGIFHTPALCQYIAQGIASKLSGHQSVTEVEGQIESFLNAPPLTTPIDVVHSCCVELFSTHKEETCENMRAYTTSDKARPSAVFWPNPIDATNGRSIYDELPYAIRQPIIDPTTPVGSAGSCFASEIAIALQNENFNYVVTEPNVNVDGSYRFMTNSPKPVSCAAWGTIFNTPSFKQLVEKAFEVRKLPRILWSSRPDGNMRYYDPFRENIEFSTPEAYLDNYEKHIAAVREAFLKVKVFVITLGLNEVWYFKADGSAFSRSPWRMAPSLVERRILTVEENVADLQRMLDIMRVHNPDFKMIVTLSPVGLHATFRADSQHVIAANSHSKAVLRVAAEEFVRRNQGVYYFPSYEVVNFCSKTPYLPDQRNVHPDTVKNVMKLFKEMYVQ